MLKIGEVAREAGVSVDTVRYYERRGLLPVAARRPSGYRTFGPAAVLRIRFARDLQAMGFALDEVAELLADVDAGAASCATETARVEAVLARVDGKMEALRVLRNRLSSTLRRCRAGTCTLLDDMGDLRSALERT